MASTSCIISFPCRLSCSNLLTSPKDPNSNNDTSSLFSKKRLPHPYSNSMFSSFSRLRVESSSRPYLLQAKLGSGGDEISSLSTEIPTPLAEEEGGGKAAPGDGTTSSTSFLSFLCPLLKLLSAGDPSQERNHNVEVATSSLSSLARYPWGSKSLPGNSDNQNIGAKDTYVPLQLFEFEACPFCRRVREALTELDLSVEVYPCPKGSVRHREIVRRTGGKEQFPFLIDPNTGASMYESDKIVKYLFSQYGNGRLPSTGLLESTILTGWMPTLLRAGRGMVLWEKANREPPAKKLQLFSYENNPYSRIVREALCELEIPYILQNVGTGSARSKLLRDVSGSEEVPFIIDPNTGTQTGDYKKILNYLFKTYSAVYP